VSPEGYKPSEILKDVALLGGLFLISQLAFSLKTRKEIGGRDHWHCADCGDQWWDGVMLHASHYNHDQSLPTYDSPESGRMQCVDCHQSYHELYVGNAAAIGLTEEGNMAAIALLEATERFHK